VSDHDVHLTVKQRDEQQLKSREAAEASRNLYYEALLRSARSGCRESLGKLLDDCRAYLMSVARSSLPKSLQPKVGASDLVQDTALEAQRDFAAFEGEQLDELLAWTRRILVNNVSNMVRSFEQTSKRDVSREVSLFDHAVVPANVARRERSTLSPLDRMVLEESIERALAQLSDEMRQVIILRNREHMSFREIGLEIGRSADASRKLWARAVERMQRAL
jgi:RNA polymerase sigma-70 factor (ECF subfamily)